MMKNKAGYTANPVACEWAGAVIEEQRRRRRDFNGSVVVGTLKLSGH